ncbi:MAG: hypothetical protein FWE90_04945 [Defluviitaleaceae bacterium]|nr:hypothetical protein [Defluviitaleaceae bacterium]
MHVTHSQTERLLRENHTFSQLGFSMLLTRLKGLYAKDDSTEALHTATTEINLFLDKFKGIMKNDCVTITNLGKGEAL